MRNIGLTILAGLFAALGLAEILTYHGDNALGGAFLTCSLLCWLNIEAIKIREKLEKL